MFLKRSYDTVTSEEKRYFNSRVNFRKFYLEDIVENYTKNPKLSFIKHLFYPLFASKKNGINKDFIVNFQNFNKFKKMLYKMGVSDIDVKELESILVNWSYSFINKNYSQEEAVQMKASFENYLDDVYSDNILMKRGILKGRKEGEIVGVEKGREEGREEGKIVGIEKGRLEIARVMKASKEPIDKIQFYTNLSQEEIEKL